MVFPVRVFTKICILAAVPPEGEEKEETGEVRDRGGAIVGRGPENGREHILTADGGSEKKGSAPAHGLSRGPRGGPAS